MRPRIPSLHAKTTDRVADENTVGTCASVSATSVCVAVAIAMISNSVMASHDGMLAVRTIRARRRTIDDVRSMSDAGDGEGVCKASEETISSSKSVSGLKGAMVADPDSMRPTESLDCSGGTAMTASKMSPTIRERTSRIPLHANDIRRDNRLNVPMMTREKIKTNWTTGESSST